MKKMLLIPILSLLITGLASASQPWDIFRPLIRIAESSPINFVTRIIVFLLAFAIFAIALKAYLKTKSKRFLLVGGAFFLFATKWGLKVLDLFVSPGYFLNDPSENVFELAILLLLFLAIFKK